MSITSKEIDWIIGNLELMIRQERLHGQPSDAIAKHALNLLNGEVIVSEGATWPMTINSAVVRWFNFVPVGDCTRDDINLLIGVLVQANRRRKVERFSEILTVFCSRKDEYKKQLDQMAINQKKRSAVDKWNTEKSATWADIAEFLGRDREDAEAVKKDIQRFCKKNQFELARKTPGRKNRTSNRKTKA